MIKSVWFRSVSLLLLLAFNTQCAEEKKSSSLAINFQSKAGALSTENIEHIFINVSSSSSPVQAFEWECDTQNCSSINFETQSGPNKLIQILVVTEDGITFENKINYGDVTASLKSGSNTLTIGLTTIGNFNSEGRIMGRYIPSATHSLAGKELTGNLSMNVAVGNNKPDMRLMTYEIFGGWFNFFVLDNVGFKYLFNGYDKQGQLYTNQPVFNDLHDITGLKISSPGIASNTNKIVKYSSTLNYFDQHNSGVYRQQQFSGKVIGFFGQNPDNRHLCSKSISAITEFNGANGRSTLCKTVMGSACSAYFRWSDIIVSGSVDGSANTCSNAALELEVELDDLGSNDDELVAFKGPFIEDASVGQDELVKLNSTNGQLSWILNSGVYLPAGIEVFTRTLASGFNFDNIRDGDHGFICENLGQHGFVSKGIVGSNINTFTLSAADYSSANLKIILCPKKPSGGYYRTAYYSGDDQGSSVPTKLSLTKAFQIDGFTGNIYPGVCYPFKLELRDNLDNQSYSQSPIVVSLISSDGANLFFKSLSDCQAVTPVITSVNVNNSEIVYFRAGASSGNYSVNATATGLVASPLFAMNLQASTPSVSYVKLVPSFYRALEMEAANTEVCVPFQVAAFSATNELTNFGTFSINFTGATDTTAAAVTSYPSKTDCDTLGTSLVNPGMPGTSSLFEVWVRVPSYVTSVSNILSSCSGTCNSINVDIVNPGSFNHLHIDKFSSGPHSGGGGDCLAFKVGAYDQHKPNSYPTNFPSSGTFSLTDDYTFGDFKSDSGCSVGTSTLGYSGGSTEADFYFGWPSSSASGSFKLYLDDSTNNHHLEYDLDVGT